MHAPGGLRFRPSSGRAIKTDDGFHQLQTVKNTNLYLTGASDGAALTLQNAIADGSQDWELVQ